MLTKRIFESADGSSGCLGRDAVVRKRWFVSIAGPKRRDEKRFSLGTGMLFSPNGFGSGPERGRASGGNWRLREARRKLADRCYESRASGRRRNAPRAESNRTTRGLLILRKSIGVKSLVA
jgi:hypothetical protein